MTTASYLIVAAAVLAVLAVAWRASCDDEPENDIWDGCTSGDQGRPA